MERYEAVFSDQGIIRKGFYFFDESNYYCFLFSNINKILWSKLINVQTGEIIDSYTSLKVANPAFMNLKFNKEMFPNSDYIVLLNKQKIHWLFMIIDKYSIKTRDELPNKSLDFIRILEAKTEDYGFFIPPELIVVDQGQLNNLINRLYVEFENNNYKIKLLEKFIDISGYEIKLNEYLL